MDYIAQKLKEQSEEFEKLISQQDSSEWISVEDRLPENKLGRSERVFVTDSKLPGVGVYDYENKVWHYQINGEEIKMSECFITHWMPIPKLPGPSLRSEIYDILFKYKENKIHIWEASKLLEKLIDSNK